MHTSQQSSDSFHGSGATLEREQGRLHLLGPPVEAVAESCGQQMFGRRIVELVSSKRIAGPFAGWR